MPLVQTRGAASAQGFGEFAQAATAVNYIEDVFSTYLYTGTGASQTITNGIDLSGKGGFVWFKDRGVDQEHTLFDTARGATYYMSLGGGDGTFPQDVNASWLTAFNNNGFNIGSGSRVSTSNSKYVSWAWRKQPKFFDIQTWTGSGANRTIAHNLGSVPACIIVKNYSDGGDWQVYHRSLANTEYLTLNTTAAKATGATRWNSTTPTSTVFSVGTDATVNASGQSYIAYIFAHDAGGFGLTGTDNVISCGSYTGNGSATGPVVTLGYEPQWLMIKKSSSTGNWQMLDNMRGIPVGSDDASLQANLTAAESFVGYLSPTSTGFQITSTNTEVNTNAATYIYIAIRRGPMKVPTSATTMFAPIARAGTSAATSIGGGSFTTDTIIAKSRGTAGIPFIWGSRLTGQVYLDSSSDGAQSSSVGTFPTNATWDISQGIKIGGGPDINDSADTFINYFLGRAPSVFDVVCYTGDGVSARVISHNLGVQPEFIAIKRRDGIGDWICNSKLSSGDYVRGQGNPNSPAGTTNMLGFSSDTGANQTLDLTGYVTSTGIQLNVLSQGGSPNTSTYTYIAYLFATCAGVSKVGSYTGTATTLQIDCGFTGGARFVLIKRTNASGGWHVWDTARGIISGNDPYLLLNSTAAEVTNTDYIDTYSAGFELSSTAPAALNASGGTYIFLAIA